MKKTFYQFEYRTAFGQRGLVSVVSAGDEEEARAFLVNPEQGGLANIDVGLSPMCIHWVPDDMPVTPIDRCEARTCWSSWRVTDWVYDIGDGKSRAEADGVMMAFNEIDGDVKRVNVQLAVARALMVKELSFEELCAMFGRRVWFVRARVFFALWRLARDGRVSQIMNRFRLEVRRAR